MTVSKWLRIQGTIWSGIMMSEAPLCL